MPELPEAETIARELNRRFAGATIGRFHLARRDILHGDPGAAAKLLPGRRIVRVWRRAKRVIFDLRTPVELVFHLGMSGRLTVASLADPVPKHTHLRIEIAETDCELRFTDPRRFGGVWFLTGRDRYVGRRLGPLGIEPLETTPARFRRLLDRKRQIKALLLDQRAIAGLGNIYVDESLHTARIHPLTRASDLQTQQAGRLLRSIKTTLNRAIRFKGSTMMDYRQADGSAGSYQQFHRVYRREGKPCRTCGTMIERITVAGRSSFVCPRCQPAG